MENKNMETINHEYYVSLEVAKLLKEAGFDWEICDGYLVHEDGDVFTTGFQIPYDFNGDNGDLFINHNGHKESFSRPTLTIAQRWLREVKNVDVVVLRAMQWIQFYYTIEHEENRTSKVDFMSLNEDLWWFKYEEALEEGIKKALEMILRLRDNFKK